ncbi:hypothetical protein KR222_009997, partial [Zaprionus bogoriensis]
LKITYLTQIMIRGREVGKRPVVELPPVVKKSSKSRSFHFRYLELCRAKNITPVPNIRANANTTTFLELLGDKLGVSEWLLLIDALHHDLVLQTIIIRMRRSNGNNIVLPIDSESRARLFRQKPVIYTRFIFNSLVEAIVNCVKLNKNLTVLKLEALPLQDSYIECIAKALASNDCLKELSFLKSYIGDKGACAVCSTVKYLNHVEIFNLGECDLTSKGAEHVADMIKMQKITRFSEGWEKSLRYRSVDVDSIAGLRNIGLANNPNLGDDGVRLVAEVLKEDAWVKSIDMENCGLTDRGANIILECLSLNSAISEFNLRHNDGISKFLMRQIRDHLGKEDEEKLKEPQFDISCINGLQSLPKGQKYTVSQLLTHTKTLEEQLSFERTLRKKAEKLNEKLNRQLMSQEPSSPPPPQPIAKVAAEPTEPSKQGLPKGYLLVNGELLQSFIKSSQSATQFNQLVNSTVTSSETTPRSDNDTLRNQLQMLSQEQLLVEQEEHEELHGANAEQQQQMPRQLLQVRKVRSEMKYVETYNKDKKRESKSDHEFANERDFKLNPKMQFELDIGDSVLVSQLQQQAERSNYEEELMKASQKTSHSKMAQYEGECMGDGVDQGTGRKHKDKLKKRLGVMGNSHMTKFMDELERKINNKSGKKRHKSKSQPSEAEVKANIEAASYMATMEETPLGSESEGEKTEAMGRSGQAYTNAPMKVFVRRTHCEEEILESQEQLEQGDEDEDDDERLISPRSVYLEIQRKKNENSH